MTSKLRLLRRKGISALWLVLLLMSSIIFLLGCGLVFSARGVRRSFEESQTTIAVPAPVNSVQKIDGMGNSFNLGDAMYSPEQIDALAGYDHVLKVDSRPIVTGYSQQLSVLTTAGDGAHLFNSLDKAYANTLLIGEFTGVTADIDAANAFAVCEGEIAVEEVILTIPGIDIPETIEFNWNVNTYDESVEFPEEGRRCIVYGRYSASDLYYKAYSESIGLPWPEAAPFISLSDGIPAVTAVQEDGSMRRLTRSEILASRDHELLPTFEYIGAQDADSFLADEDNAAWRDVLEKSKITQKSVPVFGTQSLESVFLFNQNQALIVDGREFTEEEYGAGSAVCIISEALAGNSGLSVGDKINLSFYKGEDTSGYMNIETVLTPGGDATWSIGIPLSADFVTADGFSSENREFEIIGLYRCEDRWDDGIFAISPNTVFVPTAALAGEETFQARGGTYLSVVVENGRAEEFLASLEGTELEGRFVTFDQGYEEASEAVAALERSALRLFLGAALVWALVAALFLMLYQAREKRNIGIMRSLGASPARCRGYLFGSAAALVAVASLLGAAAAGALSGYVNSLVFSGALSGEASSEYGTALSAGLEELAAGLQSAAPGFGVSLLAAAVSAGILCLALYLQADRIAKTGPRLLLGSAE